jgi:hypothetical protein
MIFFSSCCVRYSSIQARPAYALARQTWLLTRYQWRSNLGNPDDLESFGALLDAIFQAMLNYRATHRSLLEDVVLRSTVSITKRDPETLRLNKRCFRLRQVGLTVAQLFQRVLIWRIEFCIGGIGGLFAQMPAPRPESFWQALFCVHVAGARGASTRKAPEGRIFTGVLLLLILRRHAIRIRDSCNGKTAKGGFVAGKLIGSELLGESTAGQSEVQFSTGRGACFAACVA